MTRDKIKYYLYIYNKTQKLIDASNKKILEYKTQLEVVTEAYCNISACVSDGMPKTKSYFTDKILLQIEKKDKEVENIKSLIYKETSKIAEYLHAYGVISKILQESEERTKKIVEKYYFEGCTAIETCYFVGCSVSTFKRENNNLIDRIKKEIDED